MSDTDRETPLRGLAGTIDALFTALERSRAAARREGNEGEQAPPDGSPDGGLVGVAGLAPGGDVVGIADLAPDMAPVGIADLAPDEAPVDIADLAPDDAPMDMADLAPDDAPVDVADLAPDDAPMELADLAPDDAPMDMADLAPDDAPMDMADLAPDDEPVPAEAPVGEEEPARIEGLGPTAEPFGIGAMEAIPEVGIEELAPDPEPVGTAVPGQDETLPEPAGGSPVEALPDAVELYLASGGARRDELSRRIRGLAGALEERRELVPVSDAVERLIIAGRRHEQAPPVSLARLLATSGVIDLLTRRLGSVRDEERKTQLVEVAGALGERMAPAVGDALSGTDSRSARRAHMDALVAMGDDASDVVSGMLRDDRWYVVRNAVLILGEIGGRATLNHLTAALTHDDSRVRREALLALARIGGVTARTMVPKHLDDPDPQVRAAAALATGELKVERGQRLLASRLDDEKVEAVQVALIRALGRFGDPASVPDLEKRAAGGFFSRRPTEVRVAAYRALGVIGGGRARKLLQDALDDRDPAVRSAAKAALAG